MTLADENQCTGCSACCSACLRDAITLKLDKEGFLQPQIDSSLCNECGHCRSVCPVLTEQVKIQSEPKCYAFKTKDQNLLMTSSSGGAFTELAKPILDAGGVVFGCVMKRPDFIAHHTMAESMDELSYMRGSKYVQSDVRDSFSQCRKQLQKGRKVLFSGTPCQIAGLKAYLGAEYENLLTVDFICHGVPSPAVWAGYKRFQEIKAQSKLFKVSFRDKILSWKKFSISMVFENGKKIISPIGGDLYLKAFVRNFCLRKSCYQCVFKQGTGSVSDITLGDFWGVEELYPAFFDQNGASAVIIHTERGKEFFPITKSSSKILTITLNDVIMKNPSYNKAVVCPPGRVFFMRYFNRVRYFSFLLMLARRYPFKKWLIEAVYRKFGRR